MQTHSNMGLTCVAYQNQMMMTLMCMNNSHSVCVSLLADYIILGAVLDTCVEKRQEKLDTW